MTLSQFSGGELGADVADVAVDGAVGDLDVELIGRAHQLLAVEHRGRPRQERVQDAELDRGQRKRRAGEGRDMLLGIDRRAALRQRGLRRPWPRRARDAAQDDVDPRHQLARAERLRHVVVAADLEAEDAVDLLVARRQEQDRHVGGLADLAADVEPVELGHADVEHDQIGPVGGKAGERLLAVARLGHGHAGLLQRDADDLADVAVVVDDENAMRQVPLRSACGRLLVLVASSLRWSRQLRKPQLRQARSALRRQAGRGRRQLSRAEQDGLVDGRQRLRPEREEIVDVDLHAFARCFPAVGDIVVGNERIEVHQRAYI